MPLKLYEVPFNDKNKIIRFFKYFEICNLRCGVEGNDIYFVKIGSVQTRFSKKKSAVRPFLFFGDRAKWAVKSSYNMTR